MTTQIEKAYEAATAAYAAYESHMNSPVPAYLNNWGEAAEGYINATLSEARKALSENDFGRAFDITETCRRFFEGCPGGGAFRWHLDPVYSIWLEARPD